MPVRLWGIALAMLAVVVLPAGCSRGADGADPSATPEAPAVSPATASPSAGNTELTVVVDDGTGAKTTWRLTCDPPGGDHPDPQAACTILAAHGEIALPPTPKGQACTQVYGGPETASVTGTWRGQKVTSTLSRTDGCEISRWDLLQGLLPVGGR